MNEFEFHTEIKLCLVDRHDMYWYQKWLLKFGKVWQIGCQNLNFCYLFSEGKPRSN